VKHDLDHIDHWSLMFDVSILMRTPFALLKSENAYGNFWPIPKGESLVFRL
jgi:hypothetical protein